MTVCNNLYGYRSTFLIGLLSSTALVASAAQAQDVSSPSAQAVGAASGNDEIIVTAQRRDEGLSKTPVAVAVITADTLTKAQINTEADLQSATPGLSVRTSRSSNQLAYAVRGQSQDPYSSTRPGVMPYINNVQVAGNGTSTAFYDLQSVQVLKGPQGTLFGRSATGGAVLFATAKPTEEFSGYASALGGDLGAQKFEGAVSGPIAGDALLGRIAALYYSRDGYQENIYDGRTLGDIERKAVRASLTANLGNLKNELVLDYFKADGTPIATVISGVLPFTGAGAPYLPMALLYSGVATPTDRLTGIGTLSSFTGQSFGASAAFYDAYFANPKHPNGLKQELALQQARGPYVTNQDGAFGFTAENKIVTNTTTYDLGTDTQIKNIFGYVSSKTQQPNDYDGLPFGLSGNGTVAQAATFNNFDETESVSEELQILSKTLDGRLSYVAGVYYQDEELQWNTQSKFFDLLFGGQSQINNFKSTSKTLAGYAQGTYQLNDSGLAATVGLRYTSEEVGKETGATDSVRVAFGAVPPPGYDYDQTKTYNKLSWQFGLQDQINKNLLIYGVTRRAYKSGGFNNFQAPKVGGADVSGDAYKPEEVTDVELGMKYLGVLGDMPVRANIAAYHDWSSDGQRIAYVAIAGRPGATTVNVPEAVTYGVEIDGQIKPADWLTLGLVANYTHSEFTDGNVTVLGATQLYDRVTDTPIQSGTLYGDVSVPVAGDISAVFHADVYAQSKSYSSPRSANSDGTIKAGYSLVNLRFGVENEVAGWSLLANVKNVADEVYYTGGFPLGEIDQVNTALPGEPRTWTVEARYKF